MAKTKNKTYFKILEVAGELFSQRGYYGVSMRDIARGVGTTKASLYYHFSSKDELVKVLMKTAVDELKLDLKKVAENSKVPSDLVFGLVETMLNFKINHPEITMFSGVALHTDEKTPVLEFVATLKKEFLTFLRELIMSLDFIRKGTYTLVFSLVTTLIGVILVPFHSEHKNPQKLAQDFVDLINSVDR